MKVDFTFKHVDSSEALMEYAHQRLDKIEKFELKPMDVHFTISMQKHECTIEVSVIEGRRKFKAVGTSNDFYRSMEMCVNKLHRQLSKDKRRLKEHKNPERSNYGKIARLNEQLEPDFTPHKPLRRTG
ncbi:MAG TPA: ribosome-associated translation inhibitor RaiA [Bdellovibrionales bacterium]|jgi:putative sigma-54 modulation protein|nr:ribosome-associated translation inhibitor RaiA [Bdellovibrionales bacterium]